MRLLHVKTMLSVHKACQLWQLEVNKTMYCCRCVRLGSTQTSRLCPASAQPSPRAPRGSDYDMSLGTSNTGYRAVAVGQNDTVTVKVNVSQPTVDSVFVNRAMYLQRVKQAASA